MCDILNPEGPVLYQRVAAQEAHQLWLGRGGVPDGTEDRQTQTSLCY